MSRSQYYEETLYPLQDGIASVVESCKTPFYLTGGTALSRAYYNHRYSDDLDFFVNNCDDFQSWVRTVLATLRQNEYSWDAEKGFVQSPHFVSLLVSREGRDTLLKLDFVNDSAAHYGQFSTSSLFSKIDSVRNILSNKLGAVFRYSAKDIADIREIALYEQFDWPDVLIEARSKDAGVDAVAIAEVLTGIPQAAFADIVWQEPAPAWHDFAADVRMIARDLLSGGANNLHLQR